MVLQLRISRAELARLEAIAALNQQSRQAFLLDAINAAAGDCSETLIFERPVDSAG